MDVAAVGADPHLLGLAGKHGAVLDALGQLAVALLVLLLNGAHVLKQVGDVVKAFLPRRGGELSVHIGPLVVLAGGGIGQVGQGIGHTVVQELKPDLGVFLLVSGRLGKQGGNLVVTLLLRLGGVIAVFGVGLALARKRGEQVGFGLAAFQFHGAVLLF